MVKVVSCSAAAEGHGISQYLLAPFGDRTYRLRLFLAGYLAGSCQMSYTCTPKYLALERPYIWNVSQIAYKLFGRLPVKIIIIIILFRS